MKRIIIACDGTWVNSDNGWVRDSWLPWKKSGHLANASNVTRICRAILPKAEVRKGSEDIPQVVYYQGGLGSQNSFWSYLLGGYLGQGISENIREAYAFICMNYEEGDEIFLLGFSRGAFTARSIAGLIAAMGLLTRKGLSSFYPVFADWEHQTDPTWKPQYGTPAWPIAGRPNYHSDPEGYVEKLVEAGLTIPTVPIKAVGVWDTVGSLGLPDLKLLGIPLHRTSKREYAFVNTEVGYNIEYAYQALALDERRAPFSPTVWESPKPDAAVMLQELKQCWFPGVHTSIGGGFEDSSTSDITLAWMITQLSPLLSFSKEYIQTQRTNNEQYYKSKGLETKTWSLGLIPRSDQGLLNKMAGRETRTPGSYHELDPKTGKPTKRLLAKTDEFMHPSVRYRITQKGPGLSSSDKDLVGQGTYYPDAMNPKDAWTWCPAGQPWPREELGFGKGAERWDDWGKWVIKRADGSYVYIVEERIESGSVEMDLLQGWGFVVAEEVLTQ